MRHNTKKIFNKIEKIGNILGRFVYLIDKRHRRIVMRNLNLAFPKWDEEQKIKVAKATYANFITTIIELFFLKYISRDKLESIITFINMENLDKTKEQNKGIILISGHFGNWELAHIAFSAFYEPITMVARKLQFKPLENFLKDLRNMFGSRVLDKKNALNDMRAALRKKEILGILIDQGTIQKEGIETEFFGHKVMTTPSAALLARRFRCPVLPGFVIRKNGGGFEAHCLPQIDLQRTNDYSADIIANTQKMNDTIQGFIEKYPEQWFWFHKRWKRYHPELYAEDIAVKIKRRKKRRLKAAKKQKPQ